MTMNVDEALHLHGRWPKWQLLFFVIISLATMFPSCWHVFAIVFVGKFSYTCILLSFLFYFILCYVFYI